MTGVWFQQNQDCTQDGFFLRRQDILFLFVYLYPFLPLDVHVASLALNSLVLP